MKITNIHVVSISRRLWEHISYKRRIQFFLLFALMTLSSVAEIMSIGAIIPFLSVMTAPEKLFDNESLHGIIEFFKFTSADQLIFPIVVIFSLAALFSGVMRLALLIVQTKLSHAIGADLTTSLYRRTLYQKYSEHVARNSSEIIAGVGKASTVVASTIMPSLVIFSSIILIATIFFTLLVIQPNIALSALFGFGALYVFMYIFSRNKLKKCGEIVSLEQVSIIKAMQEGMGGIRDIIIDGTQELYFKIFKKSELSLRKATSDIQIISSSPRFIVESVGMIVIAFFAYYIVNSSGNIINAIPVLGAFALGAQRMLPLLQQIFANISSIKSGYANLNDVLNLLDQKLPENINKNKSPVSFVDNIILKNITFGYEPGDVIVLKDIDLTIKKGSRVGFVGATGSGKSTLIDIIMGLLYPTSGKLLVDGLNITAENSNEWQSHIGHVPQSIYLSDSTIAENIAFGVQKEKINYDKVRESAKKACISETIESLDKKYETLVGERGIRLSGGQRQRIGIARALYKNSDVIVLDEATSALDANTEKLVMDTINELDDQITVLIIAHRLSTLENCTQIIELDFGSIKNTSTPKKTLNTEFSC